MKCPVCNISIDGRPWTYTFGPEGERCSHLEERERAEAFDRAWVEPIRQRDRLLVELRAAREVLWKIKERNIPGYDTDPLGMGVIDPDYRMSRDALTRLDAFLESIGENK